MYTLPAQPLGGPSGKRSVGCVLGLRAPTTVVDTVLFALRTGSLERSVPPTGATDGSAPSVRGPGPESGAAPHPEEPTMEDLVRHHADAVYRVALSVTKDPALAEDVSQESLIKAWQSLPSFEGEAPLRHWILRIAHNTSISALRVRRENLVAPVDLPDRPSSDPPLDTHVQHRIAIERFESALGGLDGTSRSIVVLREIEGLSYAELSDVLELPLPTIRTRLLRARRQLAEALDGWQP